MDIKMEGPGLHFYFGWIALSTLAILLAFVGTFLVLALATTWIGDWIVIDGQKHITEDYLFRFVFIPLIWLFTSGLQYVILRRYLPKMWWWILVTGLGWLCAVAIAFPLERMLRDGFDYRWVVFLSTLGASIGFFQWILLRRSLPRAAWWILASALGWGLIELIIGLPFTGPFDILAIGLFPALTTAVCWWYLFRQQPKAELITA